MSKIALVIILSFFLFKVNSQVELNTKNDFIYYEFDHRENNKSGCLASLLSSVNTYPTFFSTYSSKIDKLNSDLLDGNTGRLFNAQLYSRLHNANCTDTMPTMGIVFNIPGKFPKTVFGQISSNAWIKAIVQIIYTNENSYKIKIKAFELQFISAGKIESKTLEEYYSLYLNNKKDKEAIRIFKLIHDAMVGFDQAYSEAVRRTYQLEEL